MTACTHNCTTIQNASLFELVPGIDRRVICRHEPAAFVKAPRRRVLGRNDAAQLVGTFVTQKRQDVSEQLMAAALLAHRRSGLDCFYEPATLAKGHSTQGTRPHAIAFLNKHELAWRGYELF